MGLFGDRDALQSRLRVRAGDGTWRRLLGVVQ